ncbi:hypothetical protein OGAPHI_004717 [Ogataea philodendri]|uniref:Ubiquitin-like modifier HUB1 n=1 Tax=Ogataea philodendri TaxID=1378263 RepID=A0A9P8P1V5_9ASCO|nr:uncharacterized protein OGAPHI_004717 [Ogataea philodendri]KAH3664003.1 hypothetical protein OGAPHI_004717 [Ogataea philodendri]
MLVDPSFCGCEHLQKHQVPVRAILWDEHVDEPRQQQQHVVEQLDQVQRHAGLCMLCMHGLPRLDSSSSDAPIICTLRITTTILWLTLATFSSLILYDDLYTSSDWIWSTILASMSGCGLRSSRMPASREISFQANVSTMAARARLETSLTVETSSVCATSGFSCSPSDRTVSCTVGSVYCCGTGTEVRFGGSWNMFIETDECLYLWPRLYEAFGPEFGVNGAGFSDRLSLELFIVMEPNLNGWFLTGDPLRMGELVLLGDREREYLYALVWVNEVLEPLDWVYKLGLFSSMVSSNDSSTFKSGIPVKGKDIGKENKTKKINLMIEVVCNDRLGKKIRVKCLPTDTVGDFKKIVGLQVGVDSNKVVLKKGYMIFKDHITLDDYEIHDGMNLELRVEHVEPAALLIAVAVEHLKDAGLVAASVAVIGSRPHSVDFALPKHLVPLVAELVRPVDLFEVVHLQKLVHHVDSKLVACSSRRYAEVEQLQIRVAPDQVGHGPVVRDLLEPVDHENRVDRLHVRRKPPVHAKQVVVDDCGEN